MGSLAIILLCVIVRAPWYSGRVVASYNGINLKGVLMFRRYVSVLI